MRVERPARALLGWLPDERARLIQAGLRQDVILSTEHIEAIRVAREAVAAREVLDGDHADPDDIITEAPAALDEHVAALRQNSGAAFFAEAWRVAIVDLARVRAAQATVFVDQVEERVAAVDPSDPVALARLTLPLVAGVNIPAQYDATRNAWIVTAPNPNLRIVGNGAIPMNGVVVLGFGVTITTSFMQVARFRGRYILRDGYHRAYGLLRRGILRVPAFVREFQTVEELAFPAGLLPQDAYLGPRPAMLHDYLDDTVAVDVRLPATLKMLVIQGLELSPST